MEGFQYTLKENIEAEGVPSSSEEPEVLPTEDVSLEQLDAEADNAIEEYEKAQEELNAEPGLLAEQISPRSIVFITKSNEEIEIDLNKTSVEPVFTKNADGSQRLSSFNIKFESNTLGNVSVVKGKGDIVSILGASIGGKETERERSLMEKLKYYSYIDRTSTPEVTVNSGKGIGTEAYIKINEYLHDNTNSVLGSDGIRTDEADYLWESLVRKKLAVSVKLKGYVKKGYRFLPPE